MLYTTAGTRRAAVAIDAATGEVLWMHSKNEGARGANRAATAFWTRTRLLDTFLGLVPDLALGRA